MFKFRTHGKWILAGEHSVLRGGTALVFPIESRFLDFSFTKGDSLKLEIEHENTDLEMAFWGVLEKALQNLKLERKDILGTLKLSSNIPVGAGMGASATLCVSLAKWLSGMGYLPEQDQYEFSKSLENLFHGESSGVDVAVALNDQGLEFAKPDQMKFFKPSWSPHFYLSYCGSRGVTSDCISKVQSLIAANPDLGKEIDAQMAKAVALAKESLCSTGNLELLVEAIDLAKSCFESWGLVSNDLAEHMQFLKSKGALATKPTGSGDGGFVLSLWKDNPQFPNSNEILLQA